MIKNTRKSAIIAKNSVCIDDNFSKFIGLMFSRRQDKALIFKFNKEKIISLHMIFVFYPIDVLFLNKNKIVVEMKENFKPFSFYNPKNKAKYIIELPERAIKKSNTKIKDKIEF